MLRRTKIVLAITFMVTALVAGFSYLYISEILNDQITHANETASVATSDLAYFVADAAPDLGSTKANTQRPQSVKRYLSYYLSTDKDLNVAFDSITGSWPSIYDAALVDSDGKAILHTNAALIGKQISDRPSFELIQKAKFRRQLRLIYNSPSLYDVRLPVKVRDVPFGSVRVGVSTVFLRNELTPRLHRALILSVSAIVASFFIAAGLSQIALGPLELINQSLDIVTSGDTDSPTEDDAGHDEYGLVSLKIAHLGRKMRDAREIFSALKDNVDQIMGNLQDGLVLFTRDGRVVLVSASVEKFLGRSRDQILGHNVKEIFSQESTFGGLILDAFRLQHTIDQREVDAPNAKRVQISLDFIQEKGTRIGALLTMRDAETARRIEDEIEMSRRLSASGRITRGVAHEVKNPINAIVLHLQLLQSKLQKIDPDTRRHMDIIDSEIHRLDRVVQTLVDFTRPRDLHLEKIDLHRILEDVITLATPEAEQHGVTIERQLALEPLRVKVDADFVKQAILNVVINGVQAMPQGGVLTIASYREGVQVITEIRDQGTGIPHDAQDKIFELYFTTKPQGSGIGLAQTYQTMQWHYGTVDFESLDGKGTTFRLCLPLANPLTETPEKNIAAETVTETLGLQTD